MNGGFLVHHLKLRMSKNCLKTKSNLLRSRACNTLHFDLFNNKIYWIGINLRRMVKSFSKNIFWPDHSVSTTTGRSSSSSSSSKSQLNFCVRWALNRSAFSLKFGSIVSELCRIVAKNRVRMVTRKLLLETMSTKKSSGTSRIWKKYFTLKSDLSSVGLLDVGSLNKGSINLKKNFSKTSFNEKKKFRNKW